MLWSFLSRDGTRYFKNPKLITDEVTGNVTMKFPSVYFKGYIDRSSDEAQQGPIIFDPNMQVRYFEAQTVSYNSFRLRKITLAKSVWSRDITPTTLSSLQRTTLSLPTISRLWKSISDSHKPGKIKDKAQLYECTKTKPHTFCTNILASPLRTI